MVVAVERRRGRGRGRRGRRVHRCSRCRSRSAKTTYAETTGELRAVSNVECPRRLRFCWDGCGVTKNEGKRRTRITLHRDAVERKRRGENTDEENRDDDDEEEEKIARPDAAVCPAVGGIRGRRESQFEVLERYCGNACGLWTYECVKNYWPGDKIHMNVTREITHPRHPFLRLFVGNKVPPEEKWRNFFPDVKAKGFGTCAVVAVGSNLLKSERGEEIDAHDTVIRYNSPLKKYEKSIGRKSDIMYWKIRGDEKEYGQEGQKASKFYMFKDETKLRMVASKKELNENTFKGKPILWSSPRRSSVFEAAYFLYKKENKKVSRGSASGGFKLAGDILASGLCTRVDLYGYSSEGAGKYFNLGKTMSSVHLMGLENFIYRIAQDQEMMCVYD